MKVVILAGGYGTRLAEETDVRPKPMVDIGGYPLLWHIMKFFGAQGFNEFVICLGYKGYVIKEYFMHYFLHQSDCTIDLVTNETIFHRSAAEPWKITLVDTGLDTMTGGRIRRIAPYVQAEPFFLTYGDGVADVALPALQQAHNAHGGVLTVTAVQGPGRFGALDLHQDDRVDQFTEKPQGDGSWINGGFMLCESTVFDYIDGDATIFEQEPMRQLAAEKKLFAYRHSGFWQPVDTLRDKRYLEGLWARGVAPWRIWDSHH